MEKPEPGKHTTIVVGAIMGATLIWVAFLVAGWKVGAALSAILLYEGWTLTNKFPEDTISESIWRLSKRPMVPWIFGVATGYAIAAGLFGPADQAVLCGAAFFLCGHFFFQRQEAEVVPRPPRILRQIARGSREYDLVQAHRRRTGLVYDKEAADRGDTL